MSNICSVTHCEPTQPQGHKGAFSKGLLNFTSIQGTGNSQLGEPEKSIAFLGWVKGESSCLQVNKIPRRSNCLSLSDSRVFLETQLPESPASLLTYRAERQQRMGPGQPLCGCRIGERPPGQKEAHSQQQAPAPTGCLPSLGEVWNVQLLS